jgi:metallo-beta-lactamase family protein
MKLTFHGGAASVSGANYMLESRDPASGTVTKIMIDCGLHQGTHFAEKQNFEKLPYDPAMVAAVFVTHAHIDHTGQLPKLMKNGFKGTIYSTPPTKDFAELLLLDSEHILEREADRERREPIYETEDVNAALHVWKGVPYHTPINVGPFAIRFLNAGHILGSSIVEIKAEGKTILFSGDLGNYPAPIIMPTEHPKFADYCVLESAYGNRIHEHREERQALLEDVIEDAVKAKGTLIIPVFAMERTQDLLFHMNDLVESGRIPPVPVFIDSPLAIKLTYVYQKYKNYFDAATAGRVRTGDDIFNFRGLRFTLTPEESKQINDVPPPKIVIAGSGMSTAGRILYHERKYLPDPNSTILFIGYQAEGTLGRKIMEGAGKVKIMGEEITVRAKVRRITGYSAHADQPRLLEWLAPMRSHLKKVFLVQGEQDAADALATKIRDDLAVNAEVPQAGESVEL